MKALSKGAEQAGAAIDISRQLEGMLKTLGATGKGLHERTSSIEDKLPAALVGKLRFIASVRNKLAHEDDLMPDAEFADFAAAGKQAIEELGAALGDGKRASARPKSKSRSKKAAPRPVPAAPTGGLAALGTAMRLSGLVFLAGVVFVFLLMVLGTDGPRLWIGAFAFNLLLGWHLLRKSRRARTSPR